MVPIIDASKVVVTPVDRLVIELATPADKIRVIIVAQAKTMKAWAGERGLWPSAVSAHLAGTRRDRDVAAALAEAVGVEVAELDAMLGYDTAPVR